MRGNGCARRRGGGVSAKYDTMRFGLGLATSQKGGVTPFARNQAVLYRATGGGVTLDAEVTLDVEECVFVHFLVIPREI